MKKLIAMLLVLVMALSFAACGGEKAPETQPTEAKNTVMTYAEYVAAEIDDLVTIEAYVQGTQSWWDNKITVYAQDKDGAYFLYELACSEEDAAKLVPGTKIRVTGDKAEWAGELEIMNATFEFLDADDTYIASHVDVTELLGTEELIQKQNQKVRFTGMTIESISYKNDEPGDDIYITVSYNGTNYDFCVERYLTGPETEMYKAVAYLKQGDVVDIEGFLYWYEGVNTHITGITQEGIAIVDLTPYTPYFGTWYADGSSAATRFEISDDLTWKFIDASGSSILSGNVRISEEGLQLYDPEGILAVVMTPETEGEVYTEVYMDTLMDYMTSYSYLNAVTNNEAPQAPLTGEDAGMSDAPIDDEAAALPEETLGGEESEG